jgi:WD40 repeat protein
MTLSPDNRVLVTGGFSLQFWDVTQKSEITEFALDTRDPVSEIVFSKDGKSLVATGHGGARVLKKDNGEIITLP